MEREPFHIVWFQAEHSERAMRSLALLTPEEVAARGLTHHFRYCPNAPEPSAAGTWTGKRAHCVYTNTLGTSEVWPGRLQGRELLIFADITEAVEVEPGFIGGWFKPELWSRPEIVKAAALQADHESKSRARKEVRGNAKQAAQATAIVEATLGYWRSAARLFGVNPTDIPIEELRQVVFMASMTNDKIKLPSQADWFTALGVTVEEQPSNEPYDPVSFLAPAMAGAALVKA